MDFLYGVVTGLCLAITALFVGGLTKLIWPEWPCWLQALRRRSEPSGWRYGLNEEEQQIQEENYREHHRLCLKCNPQPPSPQRSAQTSFEDTALAEEIRRGKYNLLSPSGDRPTSRSAPTGSRAGTPTP